MKKVLTFSTLFILLIILACKNDDNDISDSDLNEAFYTSFYNNNISPALTTLKSDIEQEGVYITQFRTNPTEENFELLQNQWVKCAKQFAYASVYNYIEIKQNFLDVKIYTFPTSTISVELYVEEKTIYDESYFSNKSTTTKGLGAVEYLLFNSQNTDTALELLQNDSYRIDYLEGLNLQLIRDVDNLIDFWENEYKTTFITSFGESCSTNARCLAINQLINVLDVTKVTKVGKPAGLESSSNINLTSLEAYNSLSSLTLIKSVIEGVAYVYSNGETNFASVVNNIDDTNEISSEITLQINDVYEKIEAIDTNLYTAITEEPSKVEALHTSLRELTVLFSVDITSLLSIAVLPTDNDGD